MATSNRSVYASSDFLHWKASGDLSLTPKFQRRGVWKPAARSFFIDTLLRQMPVPPVYIRTLQDTEKKRMLREVIDGQQRISAVLDFIDGKYRLAKSLRAAWAGRSFDTLSTAEQDRILGYSFSTEVFQGISDLEVLEIFSRLNTYSVKLNAQELRNGKYFGPFKMSMYALSLEHLEFWRLHRIFAEQSIARMLEVEFVSELAIAMLAGMQDKKASIDEFYSENDEDFEQQEVVEKRFRSTIDIISECFPESLGKTAFRRIPLMYSLFCAIYHRRFGLPGVTLATPKKAFGATERAGIRDAVSHLSSIVEESRVEKATPTKYQNFVAACSTQTDNLKPRLTRFRTIYSTAFGE